MTEIDDIVSHLQTLDVRVVELPAPVEEVRPNHIVAMSYTQAGIVIEALQLDPRRVKAVFSISGTGTVSICHSQADAQAAVNNVAGTWGAQFTNNGGPSIVFESQTTAKIWAVLAGASPVLSIVSERRG